MLSTVNFEEKERVLDLGCGYGVVGILAAQFVDPHEVYMIDIVKEAAILSAKNAADNGVADVNIVCSDGFESLDVTGFSLILCNPPYQANFSVPKMFIEKGFNRLKIGGRFIMVTKRRLWYKNKFIATFGGVNIKDVDSYSVFTAVKRTRHYVNGLKPRKKGRI